MALTPSQRSLTSPTRYAEMVSCALGVLHEEAGTSYHRISSYILSQYNITPSPNHFTQVSRQLETMTKNGTVLFQNGLYKYAAFRSPADFRAPLALLNQNRPRVPNANLVDSSNSGAKYQYARGNISNDVHVHMNNNVHMHAPTPAPWSMPPPASYPPTPASNSVIGPSTDEGPSKRGRGRPRKVPISAVKVEPTFILLDDDDAAGQNNVRDGPPVSPVAKKARRVKAEGVLHSSANASKAKEPAKRTCKEIYDVISNVDGITDDEVMRAVKRFMNGNVDEFDMLKSLPDNRKKRSWILLLINE
ncbi:uncharacterized protein LOC141686870 [Apium graveolens]|uniref:uncharacterized protein LOC141686870 n=1 Tax=Apium graveolens TaxID=4045 RepID=UPI003D79041D